MKISIVMICMVMISALSASAQRMETPPTTQATKTVPTKTEESIVFEKIVHDYGTIAQGADGNCEFKFTNTGKSPLILSNVKTSCGCTVPEWPKEPITPGKTGSIKVKYNTANIGSFGKTITVSSNASNSTVVLTIKGNVTPKQ